MCIVHIMCLVFFLIFLYPKNIYLRNIEHKENVELKFYIEKLKTKFKA